MDRRCRAPGCTHEPYPGRRECRRCNNARLKAADPERYAYQRLKANAKRRGKAFDLTLAEFRQFSTATGYTKGAGRSATCYHVDRIDPTRGYTRDNIQRLTNRQNRLKYVRFTWGISSPEDPDANERAIWFSTVKGTKSEINAPF